MRTQYLKELPAHWLPTAQIFAAFGDPVRQKILLVFEPDEEISIKTLVELIGLSRSAVVHHLSVLERAGLMTQRRQGREVMCRVDYHAALEAVTNLKDYINMEMQSNDNRNNA